jgi:hypothetical protein
LSNIYRNRTTRRRLDRRKAAEPTGDRNEAKEVEDIDPTQSLPEG